MRQRTTFLQQPSEAIDPSLIAVTNKILSSPPIHAARQDRLTFTLDELPQELSRVLKASQELHLRWTTSEPHETISPVVSRLSPGLHILYTSRTTRKEHLHGDGEQFEIKPPRDVVCSMLKKILGELNCPSYEECFTKTSEQRLTHTAATQYYTPLEHLADQSALKTYVQKKICNQHTTKKDCIAHASRILSASTIDLDFTSTSPSLSITAFWTPSTWQPDVRLTSTHSRLEIGFLTVEAPLKREEIRLGGFLTVLGQDHEPKPTLFSFPSRHHAASTAFSSRFLSPTGLHPTLQLSISDAKPPLQNRECSLHTYLTLTRALFADKYQLSDPLLLSLKNISKLEYMTSPVDLEAPVYAVPTWGSAVLLELKPPASTREQDVTWTVEIPLHLRYLPPTHGTAGMSEVEIPEPVLFWTCPIGAIEGDLKKNPFDRLHLGYEGLFLEDTMFSHLSPSVEKGYGSLVKSLRVPVLDLDRSGYVESWTAVVVMVGFGWVLWCLWKVWRTDGYAGPVRREDKEGQKKVQ